MSDRSRNPEQTATLSPVDLAYMAGILDGEGSILVTRRPHRTIRGRLEFTGISTIANNDLALLQWFRDAWGGTVYGPLAKRNKVRKPRTA